MESCRILSNPGSLEIINQLAFRGQIYIWHLPTWLVGDLPLWKIWVRHLGLLFPIPPMTNQSQSGSKQNGNSASITWLPKHTCTTRAGRNWVAESEGFLGVELHRGFSSRMGPEKNVPRCCSLLKKIHIMRERERKSERERERETHIFWTFLDYIIRFCPYSLHSKPIITSHCSLKVQKNMLFPLGID